MFNLRARAARNYRNSISETTERQRARRVRGAHIHILFWKHTSGTTRNPDVIGLRLIINAWNTVVKRQLSRGTRRLEYANRTFVAYRSVVPFPPVSSPETYRRLPHGTRRSYPKHGNAAFVSFLSDTLKNARRYPFNRIFRINRDK